MSNEKTYKEINRELTRLADSWYAALPDSYRNFNRYSSPFCLGISEHAACSERPLLMYVGEEPKDWRFDNGRARDLEYLQKYALAYLETQIYTLSEENSTPRDDYPDSFRKNRSPFWNFLRRLKRGIDCDVCWNDLDKLHGISESTTVPLSVEDERALHTAFDMAGRSLLLCELELVKPEMIVFMGSAYGESIRCALGADAPLSKAPRIADGETVIDVTDEWSSALSYKPHAVLWMCHPTALIRNKQHRSFYSASVGLALEIINRRRPGK